METILTVPNHQPDICKIISDIVMINHEITILITIYQLPNHQPVMLYPHDLPMSVYATTARAAVADEPCTLARPPAITLAEASNRHSLNSSWMVNGDEY